MHSPLVNDNRLAAARAFARSLNILLKCVRLYGAEHRLTAGQFSTAWAELKAALPQDPEAGFLLGVSGHKLLVDGVPLETGPAERGFAQLLTAAGVASLYFSGKMREDEFLAVVNAFAKGGSKPSAVAEELKKALSDPNAGVRVNEVRYVAHDANSGEAVASALTAKVLGEEGGKVKEWIDDPQKLLQLIAAAEGSKSGAGNGAGAGDGAGVGGQGTAGNGPVAGAPAGGAAGALQDSDFDKVVHLLAHIADSKVTDVASQKRAIEAGMSAVPPSAKAALQQVLANVAANAETRGETDRTLMIKVAEHLAIRFALDRYERGEVRVNAVREMLDRMGKEIETLRKIVGSHEDKMTKAGILAESHSDILDRAFWAQVPEQGKRMVLLSADAWCIPPRNIRSFLDDVLVQRQDVQLVISILGNYAQAVKSSDPEARRKTALGLSDLAEMYGRIGQGTLEEAVRLTGEQLEVESVLELQTLLGAALVRLAQEAGTRPDFPALRQAITCVDKLEAARPALARDVRRRISVEGRLRRFIADATRAQDLPQDLIELLKQNRRAATEELAALFSKSSRRQESEKLVEMARELGPDAVGRLRELLRARPANEAIATVGLLAHLDSTALLEWLPKRLPEWSRCQHDAVVQQIAASGMRDRARLLTSILQQLDASVLPEVIDEIGMSGDLSAGAHLLKLAEGESSSAASEYLQVKAIEALARLRHMDALPLLRVLLQSRSLLGWKHPREIRVVAAQALSKLDPEFLREYLPKSGLAQHELVIAPLDAQPESDWVRQRRYPRVVPGSNLSATAITERGRCALNIKALSLGGGLGARDARTPVSMEAVLDLQLGLRHLRPQVWMREVDAKNVSFEIVNIGLEDRAKLRKLLAGQLLRVPSGAMTQQPVRSAVHAS